MRSAGVIVAWVRMDLATVPRLRNPTHQKTVRKKKSGCFARDDSGKRKKRRACPVRNAAGAG